MAQINYADYAAKRAAAQSNSNTNYQGDGPQVVFLNSLLKNDGDTVIVRFPYKSMADVTIESCHSVTFPGDKWPRKVRCEGDNCPLCQQGVKQESRFFVKALVYTTNGQGGIDIAPAVWDRPSAFADIDLKEKMEECTDDELGALSDNLVKIKRTGTGLRDTRYTLAIVHNKTVYSPDVYAANFSLLENIDAAKILSKPMDKYLEATGVIPSKAQQTATTTSYNQAPSTPVNTYTQPAPAAREVPFDGPYTTVTPNVTSTAPVTKPVQESYMPGEQTVPYTPDPVVQPQPQQAEVQQEASTRKVYNYSFDSTPNEAPAQPQQNQTQRPTRLYSLD